MLTTLSINNIVLIDSLHLDLEKGFTSLTGETGAGKSILLDAIGLIMGGKADPEIIRLNQDHASVTAVFKLTGDIAQLTAMLSEYGIAFADELYVKRAIHRTQKSKAFINDQLVSTVFLKKIVTEFLHIHGQHDHLLDESYHKVLLNNFARAQNPDYDHLNQEITHHYSGWHAAKNDCDAYEEMLQKNEAQREFYARVIQDLEPLDVQENEEIALMERRQALLQMGKVVSTAESILKSIETPQSWINALYGFRKSIDRCDAHGLSEIQRASDAMDRAALELSEMQSELRALFDAEKTAARDLEEIEERLHLLRTLARTYRTTTEGLVELLHEAKTSTASQDDIAYERKRLADEVARYLLSYQQYEQQLYDMRIQSACCLSTAVMNELPLLKLDKAKFGVNVTRSIQPRNDGGHAVSFCVAMNAGQDMSPLSKVASGGEMARLMLILKVLLARTTDMRTIIFDEIDTGVGGAIATAIGKQMHALGKAVQVLSITHSSQVAACANYQLKVMKQDQDGETTTCVVQLDDAQRVDEIARMLSGTEVTDEAKRVAQQLMADR